MQVQVHSVHFRADQKLVRFIENKLDKLNLFHDQILHGEVFLRLENTTLENKVAEIRIAIPGKDLFAKRTCKTFEEATDTAVEALRRQLRKEKKKPTRAQIDNE